MHPSPRPCFIFRLLLCLLLLAPMGLAYAQQGPVMNSSGRDFWVAFLPNNSGTPQLVITGIEGTTVDISVPNLPWSTSVSVPESGITTVDLPSSLISSSLANRRYPFGVHVNSSADIQLLAFCHHDHFTDITSVLPTRALRTRYIVQSLPPISEYLSIVSTVDTTQVTVRIPANAYNQTADHPPLLHDSLRTFSLAKGTVYLLSGHYSGAEITSDFPVAVFVGNKETRVSTTDNPSDCDYSDHLYEQMLPVCYWADTFVVTPTTMLSGGNIVRVTAAADSTYLFRDGVCFDSLDMGMSSQFLLSPSETAFLTASNPVAVGLYLTGFTCNDSMGDPSSVFVTPQIQGLSEITFASVRTIVSSHLYCNVVTRSEYVPFMFLDGSSVSASFQPVNDQWSFAVINLAAGLHRLSCTNGTFTAYFYSFGVAESSAYSVGSTFLNLDNHLVVNGYDASMYLEGVPLCLGDNARLKVFTRDDDSVARWYIDGTFLAESSLQRNHSFTTPGVHTVTALLHAGCTGWCDTLHAVIRVIPPKFDSIVDAVCAGYLYHYGDGYYAADSSYSFSYLGAEGCDSIVTLMLNSILHPSDSVYGFFCPGDSYYWRDHVFTEPGSYIDTVRASLGCDTVRTLILAPWSQPQASIATESFCTGYNLHHLGDGAYLEWSSEPHDPLLEGHTHDEVVSVAPTVATRYTLAAHFDTARHCPSEASVTLVPTSGTTARMRVFPERLSSLSPEFDAYDLTPDAVSRTWILDGNIVGFETALHAAVSAVRDTSVLQLEVFNGFCHDTAVALLPVTRVSLWAPDAFTPEEEINNRFLPVGEGILDGILYIYARNGLLVATLPDITDFSDRSQGWDGRHNGTLCPQDAYVWILYYHSADNPAIIRTAKGTVTLLR